MSARQVSLLAALAAIWGGSYLLIKYGLDDFSAPAIVTARTLLASAVLFAVLRARGLSSGAIADLRARPWWALVLGVSAVALPFTLITIGELAVPSGLTAVLISPVALFVALMAPLIDSSERIATHQAAGMVLGLVGVALVVGVESVESVGQLLGALAMVAAAASYALSSFVVKGRYGGRLAAVQTSWVSVTVAGVVSAPAAIATAPDHVPGARAVAAVLALGVVGTALAFVIFYVLIAEVGAGRASLVSYLAPGVALLYGALLNGEEITVAAVGGLVLILAGVALASRRELSAASPTARHRAGLRLALEKLVHRRPLGRVVDGEPCPAVGERDAA